MEFSHNQKQNAKALDIWVLQYQCPHEQNVLPSKHEADKNLDFRYV